MNKLLELFLPTKNKRIAAKFISHHNRGRTPRDKCKNAGLSDRNTNHVLEMCTKYGCGLDGLLDLYRLCPTTHTLVVVVEEEEE